jgi:hypothetical protein
MKKTFTLLLGFMLSAMLSHSQTSPFSIHIESLTVQGLGGLQAYAAGQHNGKWLIIGGRLDGLHRRQPWAAFDVAGNNNQLIVVDPVSLQQWTASISSLPIALQEQLSSTNMEFHQRGDYLYIIGGYGFNAASNSKMTFAYLTAVDVPSVINAIVNVAPLDSHFRQISDPEFAVAGGHLKMINNTFYLVGGNKFDGDYNPMGHSTYTQVYTDAIRKFQVFDDGIALNVTHLTPTVDAVNFHRRDYNAVPQILPNGEEGITVFSGVFQPTIDLPYLNAVTIDSATYAVDNNFQQYYNHYHCGVLPIYSQQSNEMHNIFFGGIAQYYDDNGLLVQDNNVPFVNTIARVTRDANGAMAEYKLPVEMPALLGAGAEFIPVPSVPAYDNEVLKFDDFTTDTALVGYIFGGISSTAPNIFFTNTGSQSSASNEIFKVYVIKDNAVSADDLNEQSIGSLNMRVIPNPNDGRFKVQFNLKEDNTPTRISLYNLSGVLLDQELMNDLKSGEQLYEKRVEGMEAGGTYILTIETPEETATQRVIISSRRRH